MVLYGATELLVCNNEFDIHEHGDNLANYNHNDIDGLLNPALPPSTLLHKLKIRAKLSALTRDMNL